MTILNSNNSTAVVAELCRKFVKQQVTISVVKATEGCWNGPGNSKAICMHTVPPK